VIALYFTKIKKTKHYEEEHEKEVPWSKVVEVILTSKQKKKRGDVIEIYDKDYYIICEIREQTLYVINAKVRE